MSDFNNFNNNNPVPNQPTQLVDEMSSTEYYIGISVNGNNPLSPIWNIKKIWKNGTVWFTEYPNGDQSSSFIWNNRSGYTYK